MCSRQYTLLYCPILECFYFTGVILSLSLSLSLYYNNNIILRLFQKSPNKISTSTGTSCINCLVLTLVYRSLPGDRRWRLRWLSFRSLGVPGWDPGDAGGQSWWHVAESCSVEADWGQKHCRIKWKPSVLTLGMPNLLQQIVEVYKTHSRSLVMRHKHSTLWNKPPLKISPLWPSGSCIGIFTSFISPHSYGTIIELSAKMNTWQSMNHLASNGLSPSLVSSFS